MDRDIIIFVGTPGAGKTDARWWIYEELGEKFDYEFVNDGGHLVAVVNEDEEHRHHFHPDPESPAFCITTTYPADEMRRRVRDRLLRLLELEEGKLVLVELSGGVGDWHPDSPNRKKEEEREVDISYARMIEEGFLPEKILKRAIFVEIKTRDEDRFEWNEKRKGAPQTELHRQSFYVPKEAMDHLFAHDDFEEGLKPFLEKMSVPVVEVENFGSLPEFETNARAAVEQILKHMTEGQINGEFEGPSHPEQRF